MEQAVLVQHVAGRALLASEIYKMGAVFIIIDFLDAKPTEHCFAQGALQAGPTVVAEIVIFTTGNAVSSFLTTFPVEKIILFAQLAALLAEPGAVGQVERLSQLTAPTIAEIKPRFALETPSQDGRCFTIGDGGRV